MAKLYFLFCCIATLAITGHEGKTVTYPGIGTFNSHDFFDPIYRPFTDLFVPKSPEQMHPEFKLYTRNNPHDEEVIHWNNSASIANSKFFDPSLPVKMFIHGFMDNEFFGPYMKVMKDRFLEYEPMNMILVDWSKGNGFPYGQASVNTRVVGPMIAIQAELFVRERNMSLDQFHLLGHSLGAHVAGNAGKFLKGQLGHITGLDPAGPFFEHLPAEARLWHTDAKFVDSIHSDARMLIDHLGFGMMETCSHLDFYPNGGRDQPGCAEDRKGFLLVNILQGIRTMVACSHQRSVEFYMDILSRKQEIPKAYQCDNYEHFKEGKCTECGANGEKCAFVGPRAVEFFEKQRSHLEHGHRYFIATNHHEPFFQWNYLVKIKMAAAGTGHHEEHGKMFIKLNDKNGKAIEVQFGKEQNFHLGQTYSEVIVSLIDPSEVESLDFHWTHSILDIFASKMYIESIEVVALTSHTSTMTSVPEKANFCSPEAHDHGVTSERKAHFAKC